MALGDGQLFPDVYAVLAAAPGVLALLGDPPAVYRGLAPEGTVGPYVAWGTAGAETAGNLSDLPPADRWVVQVDCYSPDDVGVEQLARAVRDAVEPQAVFAGVPVNEQEEDTGLYRIGLEFDWWLNR